MNFNSYTPYSDSINVYVYPEDEGTNVDYIHSDLMSIIPKPVDEYLEGIDWDSTSSSSGLNYTYEQSFTPHTFDLILEYNVEGFLKSLIWTYNDYLLLNVTYMGERTGSGSTGIPFGGTFLLITFTTIALLIILVKQKIKKKQKFKMFEK